MARGTRTDLRALLLCCGLAAFGVSPTRAGSPPDRKSILATQQPRDSQGRFLANGFDSKGVSDPARAARLDHNFEVTLGRLRDREGRTGFLTRPLPPPRTTPKILFRGDQGTTPGSPMDDSRSPSFVFEHGVPADPNGSRDEIGHLFSSGGTAFKSVTTQPLTAWRYAGSSNGFVYAIDPKKLSGAKSADEILESARSTLTPHHDKSDGMYTVIDPLEREIYNYGTGEWIVPGGIPRDAVIHATRYENGKAKEILPNPHYKP